MGASPPLVRLGRKSEAADDEEEEEEKGEEMVDSGFLPFLFLRLKTAAEYHASVALADSF